MGDSVGVSVLILGKVPPPYFGPAVATEIILNSALKKRHRLFHLDTRLNTSLSTINALSLRKALILVMLYGRLFTALREFLPKVVLIPISQSRMGIVKDSVFIIISSFFPVRVVVHLRGSSFLGLYRKSGRFLRWYVRFILGKCYAGVVLGENLRYIFEEFFPVCRVFVVPNGLSCELPSRTQNTGGEVNLLFLSNLQPSKGILDVVAAISRVDEQLRKRIHLKVVGEWRDVETKGACSDLVETSDLPVSFVGPLYGKDKYQALVDADIFLFTPRSPEGHPWVIVEALAAGLPIIATDQGAVSESVLDSINGFIVKSESPDAIATRLELLLTDPHRAKEMGAASRSHYENNFTESCMVERLDKVITSVSAFES